MTHNLFVLPYWVLDFEFQVLENANTVTSN
jgi:hypothetical protein